MLVLVCVDKTADTHDILARAGVFAVNILNKEQAVAKGKTFTERPPVPPRTWNKSVPFYGGQWKERTPSSILLKVWTGTCWSWLKVRITGRELPTDAELGSPSLIL